MIAAIPTSSALRDTHGQRVRRAVFPRQRQAVPAPPKSMSRGCNEGVRPAERGPTGRGVCRALNTRANPCERLSRAATPKRGHDQELAQRRIGRDDILSRFATRCSMHNFLSRRCDYLRSVETGVIASTVTSACRLCVPADVYRRKNWKAEARSGHRGGATAPPHMQPPRIQSYSSLLARSTSLRSFSSSAKTSVRSFLASNIFFWTEAALYLLFFFSARASCEASSRFLESSASNL